jgi:hypothetical protein
MTLVPVLVNGGWEIDPRSAPVGDTDGRHNLPVS